MTDQFRTDRLSVLAWLALFVGGLAAQPFATVNAQSKPSRPRPRIELSEEDEAPAKKAEPAKAAPDTVTPTKRKAPRKPIRAAKTIAPTTEKSAPTNAPETVFIAPTDNAEPNLPERATVFFLSDVPDVEVFLNGEKAGVTNKDKRLAVALRPGHYTVTTAQGGVSNARPLMISVVGNRKDVSFSLGTPAAAPPPVKPQPRITEAPPPANPPSATVAPTPTPAPPKTETRVPEPPPKPKPVERKILLHRYLEQKNADNLTINDWKSVLTQSQQVLAETPEDSEAFLHTMFARGQLAYLAGKYEEALLLFRNAQALPSPSPLAALGLASTHLALQQPAPAIAALEPVLKTNPALASAYKLLGTAYDQQKEYKKAMQAYKDAAQRGYDGSLMTLALHQSQARQWMKEKQWKQALTLLLSDASRATTAAFWLDLGECYDQQDQLYNAAQAYTKAVTLEKNSALAWYKLGDTLFALKDYRGAKTALEQALTLDPSGRGFDAARARRQAAEAGRKF